MKVVQINAIFGSKSTGTIVKEIHDCCINNGIVSYVAYSIGPKSSPYGYRIGNILTEKWHALLSRIGGKQAYFSHFTTWLFLRWLGKIKPDVVHLHNLHNNYIHLNMLLHYLAKNDIATVITMHDCWFFTGGCTHYAATGCTKWQNSCGNCPRRWNVNAKLYDATSSVLKDRQKYLNAIPRLAMVGASQWIAEELGKSTIKPAIIRYIHNGFDFDTFKPTPSDKRKELGIEGKFVILGPSTKWMSEINKETFNYFIEHLDHNTVLVLFGNETSVKNLPSTVVQIGYTKSRKEMAELYSMADVFVNCSREDTLSSINIECQACGTPVVTYEATGSKETVDGVCSYAIKTGDFVGLWNKVESVRELAKDSFVYKCEKFVKDNFSINNYKGYLELYNTMKQL